jgi:hypothetical protein
MTDSEQALVREYRNIFMPRFLAARLDRMSDWCGWMALIRQKDVYIAAFRALP